MVRTFAVRVISPELALVDPELAAEARASLPDPAPAARAARPAPVIRLVPAPPPPRRRKRTGLRLVAGAALAGLTAGAALAFVPRVADEPRLAPSSAPAPAPEAPAPRQPRTAPPPPARSAPPPQPRTQTRPPAAPPPAAVRPPAAPPVASRPTRKVAPPPPPPARRPAPRSRPPARAYSWAPIAGAVFYHVAFTRNGKPFHDAQTRLPKLRLPARLKFPPGRYRWSVRPALVGDSGIVVGEAVVVRSFRVR
jgi:hypothetical protein